MPKVLNLIRRDNSETIEALTYLLAEARAGRVRGAAFCYHDEAGREISATTGSYKAHPDKALTAITRMSWRLALGTQ
jgi:hypothetical protein